MVQTDVEDYLDGTYPIFTDRSKLVSREQFRVPGGRDSISSPRLSSTSSCADADVCAAAAVQDNSGTTLTSGQEVGLSEKNNPQPTAIGSCGYAHFEGNIPPETAEEASRRIEHAGSTPPSTLARDSDVIIDEATEHTAHGDSSVSYEHDASYPLTIAQGQPPMERHLVSLSATPTAVPSPALPTLFPTPFPFWDASLSSPAGFAAVPPSIQVYTFAASSATEQHTIPSSSSSTVGAGASGGSTVTTHAQVGASTIAEAEVQTGSVSQVSPLGQSASPSQSLETLSSQPAPWDSLSVFEAETGVTGGLNQSSTPESSASTMPD